jgi:predicted transcriptional regulator
MPSRSPDNRAGGVIKSNARITKRYRPANRLHVRRKIRNGEIEHVRSMVVILTIAGYNNTQIAKVVNLSRGQVKDLMSEPDAIELYQDLMKTIPEAARTLMESLSIEAVQSIAEVMRNSTDDKFILQAAGDILDRTGLPKASRSESKVHKTTEELTTITDDGLIERLREAPPEIQEEAAKAIEGLENLLREYGEESEEEVIDG